MWYVQEGARWRYYERYTDNLTGKTRRLSVTKPSRSRSDQAAARRELAAMIEKQNAPRGAQQVATLGELVDRYVAWQRRHNRAQTAYNADMHCRTLLRLIGRDARLDRLTDKIIEDKIADDDPVTFNERLRRLKSLMRWAYQEGYVGDISYMDRIRRAKAPSTRVRDAEKYLEHDEIAALLEAMKIERWRLLTRFLLLTGCRVGEALALETDDVSDDVIKINKTMNPNGGGVQYTTKTETSTRDVSVQDELRDLLDEITSWRDRQIELYGHTSTVLFCCTSGGYACYQSYCKYVRELSEHVLGRRITPHALRHTHTALLAEAGIPLETISRRLGHADSKVTRDVYMHVTERMRERDAERIRGVKLGV